MVLTQTVAGRTGTQCNKSTGGYGDPADGDHEGDPSSSGGTGTGGVGAGAASQEGSLGGVANSDAVYRLLRDEAGMREELLTLRRENLRYRITSLEYKLPFVVSADCGCESWTSDFLR
jgi:hypothetical protein